MYRWDFVCRSNEQEKSSFVGGRAESYKSWLIQGDRSFSDAASELIWRNIILFFAGYDHKHVHRGARRHSVTEQENFLYSFSPVQTKIVIPFTTNLRDVIITFSGVSTKFPLAKTNIIKYQILNGSSAHAKMVKKHLRFVLPLELIHTKQH